MKYLKIQNDGVLDMRLIALMGGTTKSKDRFKIGQYGTGLKYYIAYCLRNNIDVRIFCGTEEVTVSCKSEEIAGETFDIVYLNGDRTSITTNMGMEWKAWMIIREIWCNALDEGGPVREITESPAGIEGKTIVYTQLSNEIAEVLNNWQLYFIHGKEPIYNDDKVAVYPGGDRLRIYKNGVLIHEGNDTGQKSVFDYDVLDVSINELREFRGSEGNAVTTCLYRLDKRAAQYFLERVSDEYVEGDMDLNWYGSFSNAWKEALEGVPLIHQEAINNMKARGIPVDIDRYQIVPKNVFDVLTKQFEGISALKTKKQIGKFYPQYNKDMETMVNSALAILETCNFPVDKEIIISYGFFGDNTVLARIDTSEKIIYVSNVLVSGSLFDVVAMLVEEYSHYHTGFSDCTRDFQTHFIRSYTHLLLKMNQIEL